MRGMIKAMGAFRSIIQSLFNYLNPLHRFGQDRYSYKFPLTGTLLLYAASELYVYFIVGDPYTTLSYLVPISVFVVIYFAFRDGILGGFIVIGTTTLYYFYILFTRQFDGQQLNSALNGLLALALLYIFLAAIIGWLKQTVDVLIEREANEKRRLLAIIEQLPMGVLVADAQGHIVQANTQVEKILGISFQTKLTVGKDMLIRGMLNGKSTTMKDSPLAQVLMTGKTIEQEFFITKTKKHVRVTAAPVHNKIGKVVAATEVISDITETREIEQRKDDFVNMASHELKTPITSMKLYIHLLQKKLHQYSDVSAIKTLQSIKNQTEKLQELVSDLLDVSRLQTGKLMFSMDKFDIDSLIQETIETVQATTVQHTIEYAKRKHPIWMTGDRFRIYQVVINLLTNAIKYSPNAQRVVVRVKKAEGMVTVSVRDFGMGVADADQEKIFERLYQVSDDKKRTFPGLGMGLFISKEIIKKHHGRIWVESHREKGSTFLFSIPVDSS